MNRFLWAAAGFGIFGIACFAAFPLIDAPAEGHGAMLLVLAGWLSCFIGGICLLAGYAAKL